MERIARISLEHTVALLTIVASLLSPSVLNAESVLSDLPTPEVLAKYKLPYASLNIRQKWRLRMHGLRMAPLDPLVWGSLKRERTENRRLVPIKRFFLRDSEKPGFTLKKVSFRFKFKKAKKNYMEKVPHLKDPVFDIGFGGIFTEDSPVAPPLEDRTFALRLSAFSKVDSGIILRDKERITYSTRPEPRRLRTGKWYDMAIHFDDSQVSIFLNDRPFLTHAAPGLATGLLSMQTSWHPILLEDLRITALDGQQLAQYSGLIETGKG